MGVNYIVIKNASIGTKVTALLTAIILIAFILMNCLTFINSSNLLKQSIDSDLTLPAFLLPLF